MDTSPGTHLGRVLSSLNRTQRAAYYELSKPTSGNSNVAEGIFQANAVVVGEDGAGVFPTISRINHGCSGAFNAVYSWRAGQGVGGMSH